MNENQHFTHMFVVSMSLHLSFNYNKSIRKKKSKIENKLH